MIRGKTPAEAEPTIRAIGVSPNFVAADWEASKSAHAPSFTPDAFPAVTVPFDLTIGLRLASASSVVSGRGCSSLHTTTGSPFLAGTFTGIISLANRPALADAAARCWLRYANASWSAREMRHSSAMFSAVSGIESVPYLSFIAGLTKRQPIVVSSIFAARENAASDFPITNGPRDMLSTPPAIASDDSPDLIARAATETASMLDPQSRFTVAPGTSFGRPASSNAIRATLRLSSPAWLAQPKMTSSTASQSTFE